MTEGKDVTIGAPPAKGGASDGFKAPQPPKEDKKNG